MRKRPKTTADHPKVTVSQSPEPAVKRGVVWVGERRQFPCQAGPHQGFVFVDLVPGQVIRGNIPQDAIQEWMRMGLARAESQQEAESRHRPRGSIYDRPGFVM